MVTGGRVSELFQFLVWMDDDLFGSGLKTKIIFK